MSEKDHASVAVIERGETAPVIHPLAMVQQAVNKGLDPDTIRQLMDLADRHDATEARKAYSAALVDLKRDLPTIIDRDKLVDFKTSKGPVRYTHTSLAAVMAAVTEPLTQHGFSLAWTPSTEGNTVNVTCRLTHSQGHSEETTLSAPKDTSGLKSAAQGIASTITLLQRYSCLALLGIATADMPEPQGETPSDHIDTALNMKAMRQFVASGIPKGDVERLVNKSVGQWTAVDLGILREWRDKRSKAETTNKPQQTDTSEANKEPPPDWTDTCCAVPDCNGDTVDGGIYCAEHKG